MLHCPLVPHCSHLAYSPVLTCAALAYLKPNSLASLSITAAMTSASPGPSPTPSTAPLAVSATTLYVNNLPYNWSTLDLSSSLLFTCQPASVFQPTQTTAFILFPSPAAAQHAKRALSVAPPVQAVWAVEVEEGRDVRVAVVDGKKLVREDVVKVSGLKESEVLDSGSDGLLLSSADARPLLLAVNRLQCASTAYRFSAVERPRKRKSSSFLAELGERSKSANGGLLSPTASSSTATSSATRTPTRIASPASAAAASPLSASQQPAYSYPSPSSFMPPMLLPIPPPPMPPPFPMPAGLHMPPGFLPPPPLPPPPMPPTLPPVTPEHTPSDAAPVPMSIDPSDGAAVGGGQQRGSERDRKRDDSTSNNKSETWPAKQREAEANGWDDRHRPHYNNRSERGDRSRQASPETPPLMESGPERERDRDRDWDSKGGRDTHVQHRRERLATGDQYETTVLDTERDRGRDTGERKLDNRDWQPPSNGERRWSDRDDPRTVDDRRTWRDERDEQHHSYHRGDDRTDRLDRNDAVPQRKADREFLTENNREWQERRQDSRADNDRDGRWDRRDDTKDERYIQTTVKPPLRSTSASKQTYTASQPVSDGRQRRENDSRDGWDRETERYKEWDRDREPDSSNGAHSASKRTRNDERERDEGRPTVKRWDSRSIDEDGSTSGTDRRHSMTEGGETTARRQPPPTAVQPRPSPHSTPQRPMSKATVEEEKVRDWSAERWRPNPKSIDIGSPGHTDRGATRGDSNRFVNRGGGQPSSGLTRRGSDERKTDHTSLLRIGF